MNKGITDRDMLIRLMDKVDNIGTKQAKHMTFAETKLESIEEQTIKHNGRLTVVEKDRDQMKTVFGTLSVLLTGVWAVITFILK